MTTEPNYIKKLQQENAQLKKSKSEAFKWAYYLEREEKETFKELEKLQKVYNKVVDEKIELQDFLLCAEAMEDYWKIQSSEINDENAQLIQENIYLNQRIKDLVSENTKLQNDLFTDQLQTDEADYKISQLKNEIIDLKTEIVDHRVKEYRLTKILNETSDYT